MSNSDLGAAWRYHESTNHSLERLQANRHGLDWANQPLPYKIYSTLEPIPLPTEFPPSPLSALEAIASPGNAPVAERVAEPAAPAAEERAPDPQALARLCFFSNGVTRRLRRSGGEIAFRAASCTGALYHVELYLACADLPDLQAGLYHFGAHDNGLRRLRAGDFRGLLVEASGSEPAIAAAPLVVICTSTFWRNAWKYQARAYRHTFWDTGTIMANLLAEAAALGLPARVVLGFADEPVNRLLDVDPEHEAAVCLVALGRTHAPPPPARPVGPLDLPTVPLSAREVEYPRIVAAHAASSLESGQEAAEWRGAPPPLPLPEPSGSLHPLRPPEPSALPDEPLEQVIRRRGSSRRFARQPISFEHLSAMLDRATRGIPADCLGRSGEPLGHAYLIANAVEGLAPGAYVYHWKRRALEQLKQGQTREIAAWLALGQELGGDAAVNVYFLTDLERVLERFGNRGYRAAQLTCAIVAGKLYLAAYALRLGATGLTFFDDDVTKFFSPHAQGKSVMFLLAAGQPGRRAG